MIQEDYPAAHSMDTTWFAVDEDGFVGQFDSGEAGAVPEVFLEDRRDFEEGWLHQIRCTEAVFDIRGSSLPFQSSEGHESISSWQKTSHRDLLMYLHSLDAVAPELKMGLATPILAAVECAVMMNNISAARLYELHAQGACISCTDLPRSWAKEAAERGLYMYDHITENWISGPYGRLVLPLEPLHLDDLLPEARAWLARLRMQGVRFQDALWLQPFDHFACTSWQRQYMDLQGEHHDIL